MRKLTLKTVLIRRLVLSLCFSICVTGAVCASDPAPGIQARRLTYLPSQASRVPEKPLSHPIETIRELNRDGADIFRKSGAPLYLAVGALALGADNRTQRWFLSDSKESDHRFSSRFSQLGDGKNLLFLIAALHAGGTRERETGRLLLAAELNAVLWSQGIKSLTGRERPNSARDPGEWHGPSSFKNDSFPSGHMTGATAAAVILGHEYPRAKTLFYTLAGLVGIARVKGGMHHPSDVYWGAGVGYYSGRQALLNREAVIRWSF